MDESNKWRSIHDDNFQEQEISIVTQDAREEYLETPQLWQEQIEVEGDVEITEANKPARVSLPSNEPASVSLPSLNLCLSTMNKNTNPLLQSVLKERGLSTKGNKPDLRNRLIHAMNDGVRALNETKLADV